MLLKRKDVPMSNQSHAQVHAEKIAVDEPAGVLEPVATFNGPMPTGVTVSREGRIFICFPKWGDKVDFTVAEIREGQPVAFPDTATIRPNGDNDATAFVSVQSVVVDPADRLWIVDTGSPMFKPTRRGGPKLVCVELTHGRIVKTILFDENVALPTTYLNDVRFDLRRGSEGMAFLTDSSDSGPNGLIVVDLASGESWRRLHDHPSTKAEPLETFLPTVEGRPLVSQQNNEVKPLIKMGSDGIAISADGSRLYYCPLASRQIYSVATDALVDRSLGEDEVAATIVHEGDRGGASDGLETDSEGYIYSTNYEHNSVSRLRPNGGWETVVHDPRLLWPDTLSIASDGYLYVTANQLHRQARYQGGHDRRQKPYLLFRVRINSLPLSL